MDALTILRQQYKECNEWLGATMEGVTLDQAHWTRPVQRIHWAPPTFML